MITQANLNQFIGTDHYYRHPLFRSVLYTDGVKYITDNGGAWLIDMIAANLTARPNLDRECLGMLFLELTKYEDESAILIGRQDIDQPSLIHQVISWTDYPLDKQEIWASYTMVEQSPDKYGWILYLPSEH